MGFKIDENVPLEVAALLSSRGFTVETVLSQGKSGCADNELTEACVSKIETLITLDIGFFDARLYPLQKRFGIVILQAENMGKNKIINLLMRNYQLLEQHELRGRLWKVEEDRICVI